ncbi:MAG: hypothetical protein M1817_006840 [Caeruleum heppii]|nr:MAG: hypothetical protein M1817_006840 [Caeruleum heppii]
MAPRRIIIDTDPGVDDVLAMLLALTASPEEVEVLMLSLTFGNIDVQSCLKNVVSMFHVIGRELEWRRDNGKPEGFEALKRTKPLVAVGADQPLEDQLMMADYFHGADGLQGIHETHPHLTPDQTWDTLFKPPPPSTSSINPSATATVITSSSLFTPSHLPAHKEILRLLSENPPETITIVAIGPLTNLALAASADPETFLRVKEVVVMGGTIDTAGNVQSQSPGAHQAKHPGWQITPVAEFNTFADSVASARVFALTSPDPSSTMPPPPPPSTHERHPPFLPAYPPKLSKTLPLTLFPLDVTTTHWLARDVFEATVQPLLDKGSPLAEWVHAFVHQTFLKQTHLHEGPEGLSMHDPLTIWYILTGHLSSWTASPSSPEDIRIETSGQWTRGMSVTDRRSRRRPTGEESGEQEVQGDTDGWLARSRGNRVRRIVGTPGEKDFGAWLCARIFGAEGPGGEEGVGLLGVASSIAWQVGWGMLGV